MSEQSIVYFSKPGPSNTAAVLASVGRRAKELRLKHVVVATTTGASALKAAKALPGMHIVGIHLEAGCWKIYAPPDRHTVRAAEKLGVRFHTASHTLMGNVNAAIRNQFGTVTHTEIIAHTLYLFGQGMKVAVEVAIMAADGALVPVNRDLIAVAGTGEGLDTAIVVRAAYSREFFKTRIREILCKPHL